MSFNELVNRGGIGPVIDRGCVLNRLNMIALPQGLPVTVPIGAAVAVTAAVAVAAGTKGSGGFPITEYLPLACKYLTASRSFSSMLGACSSADVSLACICSSSVALSMYCFCNSRNLSSSWGEQASFPYVSASLHLVAAALSQVTVVSICLVTSW